MNKILQAVFIIIFCGFFSISKAVTTDVPNVSPNENLEEVHLSFGDEDFETENNGFLQHVEITKEDEQKSLREKLRDTYNLEVEKYDRPDYLFKEVLSHKCKEDSVMESWHIWGAFNGYADTDFKQDGGFDARYVSNALNIGFDGFLKNNNADFRIMMGFPVNASRNYTKLLFSDVFIASNKIPHHRIQIGHFRPQVGMEGGNSAYTLDFLGRSQIARNFGTARRLGGRIKGDYSFIDYDFGLYSSGTFFDEFFPGAEFVGWMNIKPLAKVGDKYGKLKIGGGIDGGRRGDSFFVTGAYVGYEYKKFAADFEWANANGYNGYYGFSRKHASGFYVTLKYMITKKLQILACYDQFDPDKTINNNNKREYTVGLNYFIKGQALRLILNYAFCQNDNAKNSHKIMLGTQILI